MKSLLGASDISCLCVAFFYNKTSIFRLAQTEKYVTIIGMAVNKLYGLFQWNTGLDTKENDYG